MSSSTERRAVFAWQRAVPVRLVTGLVISIWLHAVVGLVWLDWAPESMPAVTVGREEKAPVATAENVSELRIRLMDAPAKTETVADPALEQPQEPLAQPLHPQHSQQTAFGSNPQDTSTGETASTSEERPAVDSAISELDGFGQIRGRFLERSELNRFPVLNNPIRFDTSTLQPEDLGWGHTDIWLYISAQGRVVAVRIDENLLSPAALKVALRGVREASFTPGYLNGKPVASKIRWRVMVTLEGEVQGTAKP